MSGEVTGRQWFRQILSDNKNMLADSNQAWLHATQNQAAELVNLLPIPDRKQENWRYTDFERLYAKEFYSQSTPITGINCDDINSWIYPESQSYRLVFVNGRYVSSLSNNDELTGLLNISNLRTALLTDKNLITQLLFRQSDRQEDIFTALNRAFLSDGLFIHVKENVKVDRPVEVVYLNVNFEKNALSQPFSLVSLENGAELMLIEHHVSTGDGEYFVNGNNRVQVGREAKLQHVCLQHESPTAHYLNRFMVNQKKASDYRALHITSGASWNRTDINVDMIENEANTELKGIFTTGASQYTDIHLDIHHTRPKCRSRADFRGIAHGQGRAVFDGRIVVEKGAQQSDALLNNKNLMLSENAEIDTKPQLEIYADDVKCGHGTTVGRIDPGQVFYMRSRGITQELARRMLCLGFAEQVITGFGDRVLHDFTLNKIAETLRHKRENAV